MSVRRQLAAIVRKEVQQTLRDRRMLFLLVVAPLVQTIAFGYVVEFDVDRVPTAVADADFSAESRAHVRRLLADGTLLRAARVATAEDGDRLLDRGEVAAVLALPPRLGQDLRAGRTAIVQVVLDGSDPMRANIVAGAASRYFAEVAGRLARRQMTERGLPAPGALSLEPRLRYNPSLRSPPFMVPGILAMLLVIVTTIVTAMGLAREREQGTLEQVMVTPIRPLWLLAGKMLPFLAIGLFDVLLVLTAGSWLFDVPLRGNLAVLAAGTFAYLFSTLGVGLFISTISRTQQQSFLAGFLYAVPSVLLSGVVTPIRSMPPWLQAITRLNPLRYFAELARANLLKGASFADEWPQFAALLVFGATILAIAAVRFGRRALAVDRSG